MGTTLITVDPQELIPVRDQLRAEKAEVDAALAELQRRETSLTRVIAGLDELIGDTSAGGPAEEHERDAGGDYPRGSEAVRVVLQDTGAKMTVREITDEILRRGWTPRSKNPENATSSAASRAAEMFPDVHRERGHGGAYVYWHGPPSVELAGPALPHEEEPSTPTVPSAPIQPPWVPQPGDTEGGGQ